MTATEYVGRFAPSPTGPLHFGSLVAALASYLDARAAGGRWLVRIEDVDVTRCRAEHSDSILATLKAFGLHWDGEVAVQSRRHDSYAAALTRLAAEGHVYGCACSRREIADSAVDGLDGPVYPGACRDRALPLSGNAVRVRTDAAPIAFVDRCQGPQQQALEREIGDFVLWRRDDLASYQLAVVVDDAEQGVTDVVRGADLIDSTARQIHLQRLLGLPTPRYLHIPVAVNAEGQKLSKQTLAPALSADAALATLRAALAFLGQAMPDAATPDACLRQAVDAWQPARIPAQRTAPVVAPLARV